MSSSFAPRVLCRLKGAFRKRVGLIPSNFIEPLVVIGTVTALLEFNGRHRHHLSFQKGEVVHVVKEGELGWLDGFVPRTGNLG